MNERPLPHKRNAEQFIGFDFGLRRIGVAVGDNITGVASLRPAVLCNDGPNWRAVRQEIEQWKPDACIVGLPLNLDGSSQAMTRRAQRFARELKKRYKLPVYLCDERLSSREADAEIRLARADGRKTRKTRKGDRDSVAARLILEHWIKSCEATRRQSIEKQFSESAPSTDTWSELAQETDRSSNALW